MKRSNTQTERQLYIDRQIREGKYPSVFQLASHWEVSSKTIKRDVEFMRDRLCAPVEYDRNRRGYYYSEETWGMPSLVMREGELVALLLARMALTQYRNLHYGEVLNRFYDRVLNTSDCRKNPLSNLISEKFSFIGAPCILDEKNILNTLCECLLGTHSVEVEYQEDGEILRDLMDPLHIANLEGTWNLFARSHDRNNLVQLKINRVQTVKDTGESFKVPEGFDPNALKQLLSGCYASEKNNFPRDAICPFGCASVSS